MDIDSVKSRLAASGRLAAMPTLAEVARAWLAHKEQVAEQKGLSWATYEKYEKRVLRLIEGLGAKPIDQIRKTDVELYVASRQGARRAPATINDELRVLRMIYSFAEDQHGVTAPRIRGVPEKKRRLRIPDTKLVIEFLSELPDHLYAPMRFSLLSGCSWHEVSQLEWQDVDFAAGVIRIGARIAFTVKTLHRQREIHMSPALREHLRLCKPKDAKPTDKVFPKARNARQLMHRLRRAKFANIGPAAMRRVFASVMAREVPEVVLQEMLGHAPGSKVTRRYYVGNTEAAVKSAFDKAGEVLG